nr:hypothetical protein [Tanacetum cinerariifolium]
AKYAQEILIKHGMTLCDSIGTPMATKHLDADLSVTLVDQTKYQSMVGALMYLTASRPDIMHATCYCAHCQAKPTEKHLTAVKQILRNKMHKAFPLPEESSHWQYKFPLSVEGVPTARRIEIPLPEEWRSHCQKFALL